MSHDYDANWDYEAVDLDDVEDIGTAIKLQIVAVVAKVREKLAPLIGDAEFCSFEVFFVQEMGLHHDVGDENVAIYVNGTASRPVVGFDLALMARCCEAEGLNLVHQFELSLAHELGHAYQESAGLGHEHGDGFHEDGAESFGIQWADRGVVELWRLDPSLHHRASMPEQSVADSPAPTTRRRKL